MEEREIINGNGPVGAADYISFSFFFLWRFAMLENKFKTKLIKEIKTRFPGSFVFHLDPTELQGAPDLLILYKNKWAALEGKKSRNASVRPNQEYYVDRLNNMSYAKIIFPENAKEVLDDMERSFEI
jgi:hypothetical protein